MKMTSAVLAALAVTLVVANRFESDHPDQPSPPLTRGYGWQASLQPAEVPVCV